jgi:hypothetical protein
MQFSSRKKNTLIHSTMVEECSDRAYCKAINLDSAAFHLTLPTCTNGRNQEYIAIIIPQRTRNLSPEPSRGNSVKSAESIQETRNKNLACQCESKTCTDDRWKSEYRSTIDECGKRVLDNVIRCKRTPIYPRSNMKTDNGKLAPHLPTTLASDKPIFRSQYDSKETHPKRKNSPLREKREVKNVAENPRVKFQTSERKPEAEPSASTYNERRNEIATGRRPMCRCRLRSGQEVTTSSTATETLIHPQTHRPLPRC